MTTPDAARRPFTPTRPRAGAPRESTSTYAEILRRVKDEGLLERRTLFYWCTFAALGAAFAGCWVAFALLGDSWFQLIVAAVLGVIFTQFAFLSHEAAHRQVFASNSRNDRFGLIVGVLLVGISYSWWMTKHTRHHGNPNTIGKDPDIALDAISFLEEDAARRRGFLRRLVRVQGYAFFPLLLLEGLNLHVQSVRHLLTTPKVDRRGTEITLFVLRFVVLLTVLVAFLPIGMAVAFLAVQLAVFGVYMGASFAPNHKGMPIIERDAKVDFFSRQVLTGRNIRGGWFMDQLMGGLNHQVEHHLFPNMPRPALKKARLLVMEHCRAHNVPYTETSLLESYAIVVRYLNRVGLAARDPFVCPVVASTRIH